MSSILVYTSSSSSSSTKKRDVKTHGAPNHVLFFVEEKQEEVYTYIRIIDFRQTFFKIVTQNRHKRIKDDSRDSLEALEYSLARN